MKERVRFFKTFAQNRKVGAISASSRFVVANVMKRIEKPLDLIVEYGPGDGVMTKALIEKLSPKGSLIAIEANPSFVKALRKIGDPRLTIIEGFVEEQIGKNKDRFKNVDLVVSSIPFSFLKPAERDKIVAQTERILAPQGSFIIFHQYSTLMRKYLEKHFKNVSTSFVPRNVFPCFVLQAKRQ